MFDCLFKNLGTKNILVIGDIVIDHFIRCKTERISSETTVPVFLYDSNSYTVGGAANVAVNISTGGQNAFICSLIGADENTPEIISFLQKFNVNTDFLMQSTRNKNTIKTRFLNRLNQQIFRYDEEFQRTLNDEEEAELLKKISVDICKFDGIIIADYSNGFLTKSFVSTVIALANKNNIPSFVDIRKTNYSIYAEATFIKPNIRDLEGILQQKLNNRDDVKAASLDLCNILKSKYVLTTCGSDGMILVNKTHILADEPACRKDVADVTGAGDTVSAYFMIGISCGLLPSEAAKLANFAAGIKVQKVGTQPVFYSEISEYDHKSKIIDNNKLREKVQELSGKKIVFTCGCFDIVHIGHLRYLKEAKKNGDILIVGLNSDSSVRKLKGQHRPINGQELRAEFLSYLDFVDYIVIFDELTSENLLNEIKPYMFVKGGDYQVENIPEYPIAVNLGIKVKVVNSMTDTSSTKIMKKIGIIDQL